MAKVNGLDGTKVAELLKGVEKIDDKIAEISASNAGKIGGLKDDISDIVAKAETFGIKPKAMRALISKQRALRRIENIRTKLEGEIQDQYDALNASVGWEDTPLGAAAEIAAKTVDMPGLTPAAVDAAGKGSAKPPAKPAPKGGSKPAKGDKPVKGGKTTFEGKGTLSVVGGTEAKGKPGVVAKGDAAKPGQPEEGFDPMATGKVTGAAAGKGLDQPPAGNA